LELASKWDSLDKNTQRYIATIAAGSRQQSRFIAMMSDYERTTDLVNAANSSAGASTKQFEKTLDSLETKLANLKTAWQEFSMGIIDSDLVKTGVDILSKLLEIINKATSQLGSFGNAATRLIGVFAIFKMAKAIFDKTKNQLEGFLVEVIKKSHEAGKEAAKQFSEGATQQAKEESAKAGGGSNKNQKTQKEKKGRKAILSNQKEVKKAQKARREQEKLLKKTEQDENSSESDIAKQREELEKLQKAEEEHKNKAKANWEEIGNSISKTG
jgi:hypothetical protein